MTGIAARFVVVPFDFSEDSAAAIDEAIRSAGDPQHVCVLHVLMDMSAAAPGAVLQNIDDEERREGVRQAIEKQFSAEEYRGLRVEVLVGDPGFQITEFARREDADLIVIPSHGRTGLKRLLIGSVAERVTRLAHCPVLVLRHEAVSE